MEIETPKESTEEMRRNRKKVNTYGTMTISTTVSRTLWEKAMKYNIGWSEAMRRGLSQILSEKGDDDFINPLQETEKFKRMMAKIEELAEDNFKMQQELNAMRGKTNDLRKTN